MEKTFGCFLLFGLGMLQHVSAQDAGRMLNEEPRIQYRAGFISSADVTAIHKLAESIGFEPVNDATQEVSGGEELCILNSSNTEEGEELLDEVAGWEATHRFEVAASTWAGLPKQNATAVVSRWQPWTPGSYLNRSSVLHLDSRLRPHHRRTVLAYLGNDHSVSEHPGVTGSYHGFTVFPCIETDDIEPKEAARREKMCSRAHRYVKLAHDRLLKIHAEGMALHPDKQLKFLQDHPELTSLPPLAPSGVRPTNWIWTPAQDAIPVAAGAMHADSLSDLAEAMCKGRAPGLRVMPEPGSALLIDSARAARRGSSLTIPDWRLWHTGCSPTMSSGHRWTIQLFFDDVINEQKTTNKKNGCNQAGHQQKHQCAAESKQ